MEGIDLSRRHTLLSPPGFANIPYLVEELERAAMGCDRRETVEFGALPRDQAPPQRVDAG